MTILFTIIAWALFVAFVAGLIKPAWIKMPTRTDATFKLGGAWIVSLILLGISSGAGPNGFWAFLSIVAVLALIAGLIEPKWLRMPNRKRVALYYGLGFFVVFVIGIAVSTSSFPASTTASSPQAPAPAQTSTLPPAVSSSSAVNDASYVSYWNQCLDNGAIADYNAQQLNLANDSITSVNYSAAVQDVENMQKDIVSAQATCLPQLEKYKPLTSDIAQANTLTVTALTETLPELKPILMDMQNSDNGTQFNTDLTALRGMDNYGDAGKIIKAWQAAEAVKNSTSSPIADDVTYVSYWNDCIEINNMDDVATQIQNVSTDVTGHNYRAAISDVEWIQTDILSAQQCLPQLASYEPLTPDVMQINTITVNFLAAMATSSNNILADMQNADYGSALTNDMLGMLPEANSYNKARELIAAWQSENPQ